MRGGGGSHRQNYYNAVCELIFNSHVERLVLLLTGELRVCMPAEGR